jgi:hypothetical protein
MNLHENLKWETILRRIEKIGSKKFRIDNDAIYEFCSQKNAFIFTCRCYANTNLAKRAKRNFINNYQ